MVFKCSMQKKMESLKESLDSEALKNALESSGFKIKSYNHRRSSIDDFVIERDGIRLSVDFFDNKCDIYDLDIPSLNAHWGHPEDYYESFKFITVEDAAKRLKGIAEAMAVIAAICSK